MTGAPPPGSAPVTVVGMVGGEVFGARARAALRDAEVIVGSPRHLAHLDGLLAERARAGTRPTVVELTGPLESSLERVAGACHRGQRACILASGDPGFFGIGRLVAQRWGRDVEILPAPSSVSLAWAAAGIHWDDASVVSVHGRPLDVAIPALTSSPKVAVLTSPDQPPHLVGRRLLDAGCGPRRVVIASRIGEPDEQITETDLDGLAAGCFPGMSVVLLIAEPPPSGRERTEKNAAAPNLSWGRDEQCFEHRDGMITKAEVRAVVLSKLDLAGARVLWDVGAGSGSVGIEAATVQPGLRVYAIERDPASAERIVGNANALGVGDQVQVVTADAPAALEDLPRPDRVFVGGGGPDVLERSWAALAPGGTLVATFVVLDHATRAHALLGELIQVQVNRARLIGTAGARLEPANPVFVAWGRR